MVQDRDDVVGLDASIIMNPRVWEATGHVETSPTRWSTARTASTASAPTT